jgi:hypothetical protein
MKCPCGRPISWANRSTYRKARDLLQTLDAAAQREDALNDMRGSTYTMLSMSREYGDTSITDEQLEEAWLAEKTPEFKRAWEAAQNLHEVAHGGEGKVLSEAEVAQLKFSLVTGTSSGLY